MSLLCKSWCRRDDGEVERCWPNITQAGPSTGCYPLLAPSDHLSPHPYFSSQPRSKYFPFPAESQNPGSPGDYLTCGGCRKKFVLADLTKFVQHKVLECSKKRSSESDEDEEEKGSGRHKSLGSPSVSGSGQVDEDEGLRIKHEDADRKPSVRDNGANTVKSGMLSGPKSRPKTVTRNRARCLAAVRCTTLCVFLHCAGCDANFTSPRAGHVHVQQLSSPTGVRLGAPPARPPRPWHPMLRREHRQGPPCAEEWSALLPTAALPSPPILLLPLPLP